MRRLKTLPFAVVVAVTGLLTSFSYSPRRPSYGGYRPYFMTRAELENSIRLADKLDLVDPGKIWIAGDYIFVVERYRGVHIINNADNTKPVNKSFIVAPGCIDVAVSSDGQTLFLDNAVDLVAFSLAKSKEVGRKKNYFPEPASPIGGRFSRNGRDDGMIVVGWKKGEYEEGLRYSDYY